jgi:hypothetical protein
VNCLFIGLSLLYKKYNFWEVWKRILRFTSARKKEQEKEAHPEVYRGVIEKG